MKFKPMKFTCFDARKEMIVGVMSYLTYIFCDRLMSAGLYAR